MDDELDFIEDETSTLNVRVYVSTDTTISADNVYFNKFWKARYITVKNFPKDGSLDDAVSAINDVLKDYPNSYFDPKTIRKRTVWRLPDGTLVIVEFFDEDVAPIFNGSYELGGTKFSAADLTPIFNGTYQLSGRNKFTSSDLAPIFAGTYEFGGRGH